MQDSPTTLELLEAVTDFLNQEIEPLVSHDPRMRFRVLIAGNVLKIISRELSSAEPLLRDEWQSLSSLTGLAGDKVPVHPAALRQEVEAMNRKLCNRLRTGDAELDEAWQAALFEHLEATTRQKLLITNPRLVKA